jgi:hypothetical protein
MTKVRHFSTMSKAELAEWDAEIEADFQKKATEAEKFIGCPWDFFADACHLTRRRTTLVTALCLFRQTKVSKRKTVTMDGPELAGLGVDRRRAREALCELEAVGIVRLRRHATQKLEVTLLWPT